MSDDSLHVWVYSASTQHSNDSSLEIELIFPFCGAASQFLIHSIAVIIAVVIHVNFSAEVIREPC